MSAPARATATAVATPTAVAATATPTAVAANWSLTAACRDADPELTWEIGDAPAFVADHCARCPVIHQCGQFADEHHADGTWAGSHRRRGSATTPHRARYLRVVPLLASAPRHHCARQDCGGPA